MHTPAPWRVLTFGVTAAWALSASTISTAASLGAGAPSAVLGQTLDFPVLVRLEPGEALSPECVAAEVTVGERKLPPPLVRTAIEPTSPTSARIRVLTLVAVDEPVLAIQLGVGCSGRMTRRYVVLADPPAVAPAFAAVPAAVPEAPPTPVSEPASAPVGPASPVAPAAESPPPASFASPVMSAASAAKPAQRRRAERAARAPASDAAPSGSPRTGTAPRRPARSRDAEAPAAPLARGRLQLEPAEAPAARSAAAAASEVARAWAAVAQAASDARAAASAASAQAARIAALEGSLEQMRAEAKASNEQAAQLRARLAQSEGASGWVTPLMLAAGLLAALAAWLAWRLGRVQAERQQNWRAGANLAVNTQQPGTPTLGMADGPDAPPSRQATAPVPFVNAERPAPAPAFARPKGSPAWPPPAPAVAWPPPASTLPPDPDTVPPMQRTEALPPSALPDAGAPRDVSIEELIDLEQQAEFFIVLGQDEAAIDLLVEHLRSTGGGSPLPYLKLLEIHHRRNDRDAYERMRSRFNHRFNAYAPEWGVDLTSGRSLDDYPGVIPRLQQVWTRPLDAMAELEALLFRKSRGELFDLPAYREVLFLYSLARDLLDRAAADTGNVDLLLPMADGSDFGTTAPTPFLGLERDAFRDTQAPDDLPTAPVDFDVSSQDRPTSIFDLLDEKNKPRGG